MLRYMFIYGKFVLLLIFFLALNSCRKQKKAVRTGLVRHEEKPSAPVLVQYIVKVEASNSYAEQFSTTVFALDNGRDSLLRDFADKVDYNPTNDKDLISQKEKDDLKAGLQGLLGNILGGGGSSGGSLFNFPKGYTLPGFTNYSISVKRPTENQDESSGSNSDASVGQEDNEKNKPPKELRYIDTFWVAKQIKVQAKMSSQKLEAMKEAKKELTIDDKKVYLRVTVLRGDMVIKTDSLIGKDAYSTKDNDKIITIVVP